MIAVSRIALIPVAMLLMAGCAPKFSCTGNMKGPGCASVSQVYARTHQQQSQSAPPPQGLPQTIEPGDPLRSPGKVLRVWMAPWVDADGDYHDQSYVYLVLNHGRWYIDAAQKRIQHRFAPRVTPPVKEAPEGRAAPHDAATNAMDASRVLK